MTQEALLYLNAGLLLAGLAGLVWVLARLNALRDDPARHQEIESLKNELARQEQVLRQELELSRQQAETRAQGLRQEVVATMNALAQTQQQQLSALGGKLDGFGQEMRRELGQAQQLISTTLTGMGGAQTQKLDAVQKALEGVQSEVSSKLNDFGKEMRKELGDAREQAQRHSEQARTELAQGLKDARTLISGDLKGVADQLAKVSQTVSDSLERLRQDNEAKLEQMRATVDEKLQSTLSERLGASFRQVSEHLQKVHQSVGEMQELAKGVGDLKRVLGEVKSRGIWGEVQLGALLEQALAPEQYQRDVEIPPGSGRKVEYAIRLPGSRQGGALWLPIDAKFPLLDYQRLVEAAESADKAGVEAAGKSLERFVKEKAKEIEKYVVPPLTTNFAVMFLPVEGLYAEILRRSELVHELQHKHRIMLAGPTTLFALLNSLQMGFRTLAIEQRSAEVWKLLEAVKSEFAKYGEVIAKVRDSLHKADQHLDKVGTRTRAIDKKLKDVATLPEAQAAGLLGLPPGETVPLADDEEDGRG